MFAVHTVLSLFFSAWNAALSPSPPACLESPTFFTDCVLHEAFSDPLQIRTLCLPAWNPTTYALMYLLKPLSQYYCVLQPI